MKALNLSFGNIFGAVLLLGYLLGCSFYYNPLLDPTLLPRFSIVIGFFIVLYIFIILNGKATSFFDQITQYPILASFCLMICYAFSILYSNVFSEAVFEMERNFLFTSTLLFTGFAIRVYPKFEARFIQMTIVFGWIVLIIALFQIQRLTEFTDWYLYFIYSISGHKNLLSSLLFLLTIFATVGIGKLPIVWKTLSFINLGLYLWLISYIQTRAVWVGIIIAILYTSILVLFYFRKKVKTTTWIFIVFSILTLIIVLWFAIFHFATDQQKTRLQFWNYASTFSGGERLLLWKKTIQMLSQDWILGCGSGQWQFEFLKSGCNGLEISMSNNITFQRPHNDLLWVLSEVGVVGFIFYIILWSSVITSSVKYIFSMPLKNCWPKVIYSSGIVGYLVISFFDFPKERIEHTLMAATLIMLTMHDSNIPKFNLKKWEPKLTFGLSLIWPFLFILTSITLYHRWKGEVHAKKMNECYKSGDYSCTMTESKRAYSIWYMSDATSIPLTWYQGISGFYLNLPDKGLSYSLDSYRLSPYNIHVLNNLGSAYEANGDHTSAKKCFEKALDLYNSFDAAKFNLSVMLYNEGKYKEARELVESTTSDNTKKETFLQVINQKLTE